MEIGHEIVLMQSKSHWNMEIVYEIAVQTEFVIWSSQPWFMAESA